MCLPVLAFAMWKYGAELFSPWPNLKFYNDFAWDFFLHGWEKPHLSDRNYTLALSDKSFKCVETVSLCHMTQPSP